MADTVKTLTSIALNNKGRLAATFSLVILENLLLLLYPLVGSVAVNAVLAGNMWQALAYAFMVFVIWSVGSARRAVDTRAFVRIYADLAVRAVLNEKQKGSTSSATAHAVLAREFVDFFETQLPVLITSVCSLAGAVIMLLLIEFWSGVAALAVLLVFCAGLPRYIKINDRLYFKLNNRLEHEVRVIERSNRSGLIKHYRLLSKMRIAISNREALSYLLIGVAMTLLFGTTLVIMSSKTVDAGHVYAVSTYLWGFAFSLDDMPYLAEKFSSLKDVGRRVEVGDGDG